MSGKFAITESESESSDLEDRKLELITSELKLAGDRLNLRSHSLAFLGTGAEAESRNNTKGFPFWWRLQSTKYGRQLQRMGDEYNSLLCKREMRTVKKTRPTPHSKTWWSYLFSHKETEGENKRRDSPRTEPKETVPTEEPDVGPGDLAHSSTSDPQQPSVSEEEEQEGEKVTDEAEHGQPLSSEAGVEPSAWEDFTPVISAQSRKISYGFRCPGPGAFHCSSTGLVFVVREGAELQYRTVQWDEALLEGAGRRAAGPLYDIECSGKALRKLHLPHCEAPEVDLSQSCLSVAHITDAGMSFIPPLRISQTHVEIEISSLSVFGLVWQWLFEKHKPISGQVLLFSTPRPPPTQTLKLNMFLLPRNISVDTVEQKQRTTTQYLDAPSKCRLVIDKHYSVVCPSAEKVQPDRALFDMDHEPNYHPSFELRLPPESSQVSITVTEVEDSSKVWTHELDLTVLLNKNQTTTHQSDCAEAKLRSVRTEFVENVSNPVLNQLLDRLLDKKIVNSEEMEVAKDMPRADKARHVVDVVLKKGSRAASVLIQDFCKLDPSSDLCQKLSHPDL